MKPRGFDRPLYIQPLDHAGSFVTGMFGWYGGLTPDQTEEKARPSRRFTGDARVRRAGIVARTGSFLAFLRVLASRPARCELRKRGGKWKPMS